MPRIIRFEFQRREFYWSEQWPQGITRASRGSIPVTKITANETFVLRWLDIVRRWQSSFCRCRMISIGPMCLFIKYRKPNQAMLTNHFKIHFLVAYSILSVIRIVPLDRVIRGGHLRRWQSYQTVRLLQEGISFVVDPASWDYIWSWPRVCNSLITHWMHESLSPWWIVINPSVMW